MKKLTLLTGLISAALFNAQIKFEKGYLIHNSGERTEVFIKNLDWKNNPTEFEYKTDESGAIQKENIKNVQEFGMDHGDKYIRKTVMIDKSSDELRQMSETRDPEFVEETLFLKYLVEGKADLLYYENSNIRKFFFSKDDSDVKQLLYKPYYINESQISYNEEYKNQLTALTCGIEKKELQRVRYQQNDLSKLFMNYNNCSGGQSTDHTQSAEKKDLFNLTIRPGISSSSLKTVYSSYSASDETKFGNKTTFRAGVELEFVLPFNKNKWSLFVEPTYNYYQSEIETTMYPGTYFEQKSKRSVDYKSIEVPFGIRHYFFLNDQSKIFVNAAYLVDFGFKSNLKYDYLDLEVNSGNNLILGAGYKYNDRFGVEFRIGTPRTLLRNYMVWDSDYTTMSLIFGYTLF
ncbi:outer membrane beta-barrel protein [Chryseobacterium fluminis]|uniref:outer membrane beta-barrel protein n=1 Tax=Chryseobacterium fluminis TaxID=2983606 RepID=UPI0022566742|nr:outer membrane beta-barrel protein [Chryseobacterium sp. MMS21-Ot14]UZT97520.1 outer membrane beta-barrel protein [Chryseobacterium sp. MMS21-Ot14]